MDPDSAETLTEFGVSSPQAPRIVTHDFKSSGYHSLEEELNRLPSAKSPRRLIASGYITKAISNSFGPLPPFTLALYAIFWLLSIPLTVALIYENDQISKLTTLQWFAIVIPIPPVIALQLLLGIPRAQREIQTFLWTPALREAEEQALSEVSGLGGNSEAVRGREIGRINQWTTFKVHLPLLTILTLSYILSGALSKNFDPYALVCFIAICTSVLGTLHALKQSATRMVLWGDMLVFLFLWLMLDWRWNYTLWTGPMSFKYNWWAFVTSILVVYGWGIFKATPSFGYRLIPYPSTLAAAFLGLIGFGSLAIPIGLGTGFLAVPKSAPEALGFMSEIVDLFLGVAIPEELFFRNILQHGILDRIMYSSKESDDDPDMPSPWGKGCLAWLKRQKWKSLLVASFFFGLMHWPEMEDLLQRTLYCLFSFVAGLFYGTAFRLDGNNILGSAITHTLVDTVWVTLLK